MSDSPFQPPPFDDEVGDDGLDEDEGLDDDEDEGLDDDEDEALDDEEEDDEDEALDDEGLEVGEHGVRRSGESGRGGNDISGGAARAVLEHVARSIVDTPDAVVVEVNQGRSGAKLSLHVDPADMGRIIGKRGRVAQAIRVLVRAAAARDDTDASVDIVD